MPPIQISCANLLYFALNVIVQMWQGQGDKGKGKQYAHIPGLAETIRMSFVFSR
jgi:hypothetical protein